MTLQDGAHQPMLVFDIPYIFECAGGIPGVIKLCRATVPTALPPSPQTVAVWKHRERISAEWLPVVVYALMKAGIPPRFRRAEDVRRHGLAALGL